MNMPELARQNMIAGQLKPNRITQTQILTAFSYVSREDFVPAEQEHLAYSDAHVPLSKNRFLLASLPLAQLLQIAQIKETDRILIVGCATGYSLTILAQLVSSIVAVESDTDLYSTAQTQCDRLNLTSVSLSQAPLLMGYAEKTPYDVILIEGCISEVPDTLTNQLAEGGRLVCFLKTSTFDLAQGVRITRINDVLTQVSMVDANVPFLPEFSPKEMFDL